MTHILRMTIEWSASVKYALIAIASVILLASVLLLVHEIIGRKRDRAILVSYAPAVEAAPISATLTEEVPEVLVAVPDEPVSIASEEVLDTLSEEREPEEPVEIIEPEETEEIQNYADIAGEAEAIVDTVAAGMLVDDATLASESFVMNGKTIYVRYNRSFTARLHQSDDKTKENYSIVKNHLLKYGAKVRMSCDEKDEAHDCHDDEHHGYHQIQHRGVDGA